LSVFFCFILGRLIPPGASSGALGVLLGAGDINIELRGVEEFAILCAVK